MIYKVLVDISSVPRRILREMEVDNAFPYALCDDGDGESPFDDGGPGGGGSNIQEVPWQTIPSKDAAPVYPGQAPTKWATSTSTIAPGEFIDISTSTSTTAPGEFIYIIHKYYSPD